MQRIGIPTEIMTGEARIALTPMACKVLVAEGCEVFVQRGAGELSGYADADYMQSGAVLVDSAAALYASAQLIVKVKQPLDEDLSLLTAQHTLFSYLHLAADIPLIDRLCAIGLTAIPFESVADDGNLVLLTPMSQVAGRIAAIRGASLLFRNRGGRGVLLGGVEGSEAGHAVVLGAGVAGSHAVASLVALGARVSVVDLDRAKLQSLKREYPLIDTFESTPDIIERLCLDADLVIGAVLLAGRRAPVILKQAVIERMPEGSVIVDIAIDQGGCVENIELTDSEKLCYIRHGVIHSAVPNMPAAVARTASQSLSSAVLPYVLALAKLENGSSTTSDPARSLVAALQKAVAISAGKVVDKVLSREIE